MNQNEILLEMKRLSASIHSATDAIESQNNTSFFKALIQKNCMELFELIQKMDTLNIKSAPTLEKRVEPPVEFKAPEAKPIPPAIEQVAEPVKKIETTLKPETQIVEPVKKNIPVETIDSKVSVNDSASTENELLSLNDKISKNKVPVMNVAEKSKETPIKDLSKAISISKKFEFISGLFNGNGEAYKHCIHSVQNALSYDEAILIIEPVLKDAEELEETEHLATEFYSLVKRRFLS